MKEEVIFLDGKVYDSNGNFVKEYSKKLETLTETKKVILRKRHEFTCIEFPCTCKDKK